MRLSEATTSRNSAYIGGKTPNATRTIGHCVHGATLRQRQKPARGHGKNWDSKPKGDAQHGCEQCRSP
jgi:hypothetical protein